MVANMSIEGPPDAATDLAVSNSIAAGVSYAIAAGNGNIFGFGVDACGVSPGRVGVAMTVGATGTTTRGRPSRTMAPASTGSRRA